MATLRAVLTWVIVGSGLLARAAVADPICHGDYAEDLGGMSKLGQTIEHEAKTYSFAVRTSATYECIAYGSDGAIERTPIPVQAYGTAFGYRYAGGDTLLLTNDHVAEWPAVSDADHPVDGVPAGCKRVSDALAIVDDDHDEYTPDDIPLERVVADPALDVAVLRAHQKLGILPWRVGTSANLKTRAAVLVKGFPLGEFRATNSGKVVTAHSHDDQGDWDHDDFVVDALLTSGGSGSPVLALSCKTGELELVGIFHARYTAASALNLVIAIDQVKDMMATLTVPKRPGPPALDGAARQRLAEAVRAGAGAGSATSAPAFFAVGGLVASVRAQADGALEYALYASDFPRTAAPVLVVEDLPPAAGDATSFGALGRVNGTAVTAPTPELAKALALFRRDALATFDYRAATAAPATSRAAFDKAAKQGRELDRLLEQQHAQAQALVEVAGRLEPQAGGAGGTATATTTASASASAPAPAAPTLPPAR